MKLDADKLRGEAEEHAARMKSPLWQTDDGQADEDWTVSLRNNPPTSSESASSAPSYDSPPRPPPMPRAPSSDVSTMEILPRLDALDHAVEKLTAVVSRRPVGSDGFPGWLEGAAGDPHAYSGPDAGRTGVCARILPTTSSNRRSAGWDFARVRRRGSSSCGWASRRQNDCRLHSGRRTKKARVERRGRDRGAGAAGPER